MAPLATSRQDPYGGVSIAAATVEGLRPTELHTALAASLTAWRSKGIRAVWLTLSHASTACGLLSVAMAHGFSLHHVTPDGGIVANVWLPAGVENRCPPGPGHFIGVGGFCYDADTDCVLVVQEKTGPTAGRAIWKLPGGLVDVGEDLHAAARREVREETGVDAHFVSLCSLQELHNARGASRAGCSDIYCIALMQPSLDGGVQPPRPQEAEIARCEWLPVDAFLAQPYLQGTSIFASAMSAVAAAARRRWQSAEEDPHTSGLCHESLPLRFLPGNASLYSCATCPRTRPQAAQARAKL